MYAIICYFLLDVRANLSCGTWVPWSIDSFEKYTRVHYICTISYHVHYNLFSSFGCSGEPVQREVSSLKYRFLWKIHAYFISYMHNIISCTLYSVIFFWMFGRTSRRYVSSLKYRFLWKIHSCTLYNICKYHLMYAIICYFLLDVRANQSGGTWVPWSIDSLAKYTRVLYICITLSHVRYNLLFSFGCSGEPVRRYVSSLKYRFLWKIHLCTLYMHNIITYSH